MRTEPRAAPAAPASSGPRWFYSDDEIDKRAHRENVIPVRLENTRVNEEALRHFACWLRFLGITFDSSGAQRPWVPVGIVGPVLIIGHSHPYEHSGHAQTAPLPSWCAQHVLLSDDQHTALIKATELMFRTADTSQLDTPSTNALLKPRPSFQKKSDVIQFMIRSLVMAKAIRRQLVHEENRQSSTWADELKGFAEAAQFFIKRTAIIDVRGIAADKTMLETVPREVFTKFQAIGIFATANFYYTASPIVPNPALQDRLLTSAQGTLKRKGVIQALCPSYILSDTIAHRSIAAEKAHVLSGGATRSTIPTSKTASDQSKASITIDEAKIKNVVPLDPKCDNVDRLHWYLLTGARVGASDLHFETRDGKGVVRARIDGALRVLGEHPENQVRGMIGVAKGGAIQGLEQSTHNPQDGRGTMRIGDKLVNLRVSLTPHLNDGFQTTVVRLLPKGGNLLKILNLGIPDRQIQILKRALRTSRGMVILTGPTGSGKTTATYACLNELNDGSRKINTIEDPVEIELPGATQSVVNDEIAEKPVTMASLLNAALRQDPEVIVIGEIRDKETADISIRAAMTGHFVFATMHTSTPATAVTRFIDLLEKPALTPAVAENIILLAATELVRKVCQDCSSIDENGPTLEEKAMLERHGIRRAVKIRRANPNGCSSCAMQGYTTRTGVMSLIPVVPEIKEAIRMGKSSSEIEEIAKKHKFWSLERELLQKVLDGVTTFEEIISGVDPWADFKFTSPDADDETEPNKKSTDAEPSATDEPESP